MFVIFNVACSHCDPPVTLQFIEHQVADVSDEFYEENKEKMRKLSETELKIITSSRQGRGNMNKPEWANADWESGVESTPEEDVLDPPEETTTAQDENYDWGQHTVAELNEYANENDIEGIKSGMNKDAIIEIIKQAVAE